MVMALATDNTRPNMLAKDFYSFPPSDVTAFRETNRMLLPRTQTINSKTMKIRLFIFSKRKKKSLAINQKQEKKKFRKAEAKTSKLKNVVNCKYKKRTITLTQKVK